MMQRQAYGHLLRRVDCRVESAHSLECLARTEEETSEGNAHHSGKPDFNRYENSEINWNASAVANGAATPNGAQAHRLNCGADSLRGDDGVGVNEDEQIALRRPRPGVACR